MRDRAINLGRKHTCACVTNEGRGSGYSWLQEAHETR